MLLDSFKLNGKQEFEWHQNTRLELFFDYIDRDSNLSIISYTNLQRCTEFEGYVFKDMQRF